MSKPWHNLNPPVTLSKLLPVPLLQSAQSRMERESPRPVIGMLPRVLKAEPHGLARDPNTLPLPVDAYALTPPLRAVSMPAPFVAGEQFARETPIPRVVIENYRQCQSQTLLGPRKPDPASGRTRLEALNGRLIVRAGVEVGQHPCSLDPTGTRDLVLELRRQALVRDLVVLERSIRGVEEDGLHPLVQASLRRADARPVHKAIVVDRPRTAPRLIGPRLRIPIPRIDQPVS